MHGDSLLMLSPLGLSNRKPLPLGMGYITKEDVGKPTEQRQPIKRTLYGKKENKRGYA